MSLASYYNYFADIFKTYIVNFDSLICLRLIPMQNAMISSIVHVTNIPRRRVVKWFEDKRAEEGVPGHRVPYQRSVSETA